MLPEVAVAVVLKEVGQQMVEVPTGAEEVMIQVGVELSTVLGQLLFESNLLQLLLHFISNKLLYKLLYRYFITSLKLQGL